MKIKLAKCLVFQVGDVDAIQRLANVLGCKVGSLPSYLGFPLGAKFKSKVIWNPVIECILFQLNSWKAPFLSKDGRLILVKSVLASIPNYDLLFTISVLVAKIIESYFRSFLWNDLEECCKYHLVNWKIVCLSKKKGGLGIKDIRLHDFALFGKWLWRLGGGEK